MEFSARMITCFFRLLGRQPLKAHLRWSKFLRWLVEDVMRYRKDVVIINLARSFPDKKYKEIRKIADESYLHFADVITEGIWFSGSSNRKRLHDQHIVGIANPEKLKEIYDNSRSVVILTSHMGNWELTGGIHEYFYGFEPFICENNFSVVYKPIKSKTWDELMACNRCAPVGGPNEECYIDSADILLFILHNKINKRIYMFPTDQAPYAKAGKHHVNMFMHQETKSMFGGAGIAHKFGFSVVYQSFLIEERGKYKIEYKEICRDASQTDPEEIMNKFYLLLQADLEKQPWNYLWTHKRWK